MFDTFVSQNMELSFLLWVFLSELLLLFFIKEPLGREKLYEWFVITIFMMFLFLGEIFRGIDILVLITFAGKEFFSLIKRDSWWVKIPTFLFFFVLLLVFSVCIFFFPLGFLVFFILVLLSEVVAYGIDTSISWKKNLTAGAPRKSLGGIIGQVIVVSVVVGLVFIFFWGTTPIWGLIFGLIIGWITPVGSILVDSLKKQGGEIDMGNYRVLSRFSASIFGIVTFLVMYLLAVVWWMP